MKVKVGESHRLFYDMYVVDCGVYRSNVHPNEAGLMLHSTQSDVLPKIASQLFPSLILAIAAILLVYRFMAHCIGSQYSLV